VATVKGYLDQMCKNLKSTKSIKPFPVPGAAAGLIDTDDLFPSSEVENPTTHYCYTATISPEHSGQVHSDQTGNFPIASSTGNNKLSLVYEYNSNGILAEPIPNHTGLYILYAYKT
jgi:hypothetical protein